MKKNGKIHVVKVGHSMGCQKEGISRPESIHAFKKVKH